MTDQPPAKPEPPAPEATATEEGTRVVEHPEMEKLFPPDMSAPEATTADMIEQFCRDLNSAHDEILRLQGVSPERYSQYDWPEWSGPANSIRWAERFLGKPLSKTSQRGPTP